jgi:hypothetical protein
MSPAAHRVHTWVGDWKRGGRQRDTTFPKGTALRKMTGWQTQMRATLMRQRLVPATGTLESVVVLCAGCATRSSAKPNDPIRWSWSLVFRLARLKELKKKGGKRPGAGMPKGYRPEKTRRICPRRSKTISQ